MNLFADYIQPLTDWLQTNPHWSLFITFLISLSESLVIIGIIIPGSVTMTAIGILAGSGVMRLDYTLIAAIAGAICGDSLSYALGLIYSDRLNTIWPFSKYPKWLDYGKEFFKQHGGKSVLIGRFVGPLRALIPIVAGMMHMKQWRFLVANVLSAIGWSMLYIMPGALIGAASKELSSEIATRLFLTVLLILVCIWLISMGIKWFFIRLHSFYTTNVNAFWSHLKDMRGAKYLYVALTPKDEDNHYATVLYACLTSFCLLAFIVLLLVNSYTPWLSALNTSINFLMQSLQTAMLKALFIVCTQYTHLITIISLYILVCLACIRQKNYTLLIYATNIILLCILSSLGWYYFLNSSWSKPIFFNQVSAVALSIFLILCMNTTYVFFNHAIKGLTLILLTLSTIGSLYLSDVSFSHLMICFFEGTSIGLIHYLIFRAHYLSEANNPKSIFLPILFFLGIFCSMSVATCINYKRIMNNHLPCYTQQVLTEKNWWEQKKPILPLYRLNRIGKKISLLNIQYSGSLEQLTKTFQEKGWEASTASFTEKLLMRMKKNNNLKFPLLPQLYEHQAPKLVMTYEMDNPQSIWVFYLWESHFRLTSHADALWIGSIYQIYPNAASKKINLRPISMTPLSHLSSLLFDYDLKQINLNESLLKPTFYPSIPSIFLIKAKKLNP